MASVLSLLMIVAVASQTTPELHLGECPYPCMYGDKLFCNSIPCAQLGCKETVHTPGDCCPHCVTPQQEVTPYSMECPYPCTINGHHFCHPIPCPLPPCVDAETDPGICCPSCPNGPNCPAPGGHVVAFNQSEIINGKNCTCIHPLMTTTCV